MIHVLEQLRQQQIAGGASPAVAYIAKLNETVTLTGTEETVITTLIDGYVSSGIWNKRTAIYMPLWSDVTANSYNMKDPRDLDEAFRLTWIQPTTPWIHQSTGALPNGIDTEADSYVNPSTHLSLGSASLGYYSDNESSNKYDAGLLWMALDGGSFRSWAFSDGKASSDGTTQNGGWHLGNRASVTDNRNFRDGLQSGTTNTFDVSGQSLPNNTIYFGALRGSTNSFREFKFGVVGEGLTPAEVLIEYNLIQDAMTSLGKLADIELYPQDNALSESVDLNTVNNFTSFGSTTNSNSTLPYHGTYSLRLISDTGTNDYAATTIPVTNGAYYKVSFWVKNTLGTGAGIANWTGVVTSPNANYTDTVWTNYSYDVVANSTSMEIRFYSSLGTKVLGDTNFWDLMTIKKTR